MLTKYNLAKWSAVIAFLIFGLTIKAAFAQQIPFQELSSIGCQFLTGEEEKEIYQKLYQLWRQKSPGPATNDWLCREV